MHSNLSKPSDDDKDVMGIVEMLIVLAKNKKTIVGATLAAALVASAGSMLLPPFYRASVKLLPPQQAQSGASMLLSQLGGLAGAAAGATGLKNPADVYIGMLKSRTVGERLAKRFALQAHYGVKSQEQTLKLLGANTVVAVGKDGLIAIDVEDTEKKLVAPLANAYVEELVRLTKTLAVTEGAQRRLFYEQELERSKNKLANAEIALKTAIDQRGVISVDAESRGLLETGARLRAEISAKDIELNSMKAFVTPNNPAYRRVEELLRSLRAELSQLENGRRPPSVADRAAGEGAKAGVQSIQLLRDVKYYQILFEALSKQYEAARLDEAKDSSVIQVLDQAIEPEQRFKPKRSMLVVASSLLVCLITMFFVLLREIKNRWLLSPRSFAQWSALKASMRLK